MKRYTIPITTLLFSITTASLFFLLTKCQFTFSEFFEVKCVLTGGAAAFISTLTGFLTGLQLCNIQAADREKYVYFFFLHPWLLPPIYHIFALSLNNSLNFRSEGLFFLNFFYIIHPYSVYLTVEKYRNIDEEIIEAFYSIKPSRKEILRNLVLPLLMPTLKRGFFFSAIRFAIDIITILLSPIVVFNPDLAFLPLSLIYLVESVYFILSIFYSLNLIKRLRRQEIEDTIDEH